MNPVKVFCTTGGEEIGKAIFGYLKPMMGKYAQMETLAGHSVTRFSNDNLEVKVDEVRGCTAVVIHTQVLPVDMHTIELFAMLQAMRDAHVGDILLVFPYMPYSRSDRKNKPRISTMGKLFPEIISKVFRVKHVVLSDPHDSHLKHYFDPVADEITSIYLFADRLQKTYIPKFGKESCVAVYADTTALKRYSTLAHLTGLPTAFIDKDRPDDSENPDVNKLVGDVEGKTCILMDDEILTGGTSFKDSEMILKAGAKRVIAAAVHPIFENKDCTTEELMYRLTHSDIESFIIGNTVPIAHKILQSEKFDVVHLERFLAEAIKRCLFNESLTGMHGPQSVPLGYIG